VHRSRGNNVQEIWGSIGEEGTWTAGFLSTTPDTLRPLPDSHFHTIL